LEKTKTNESGFTETAQKAADWIAERDDFHVIGHFDADGLTSIGIIGQTLFRLGKKFESKAIKQLYADELDGIEKQNIIFLDLGSGQINTIREKLKGKNILILDHHTPEETGSAKTGNSESGSSKDESESIKSEPESEILEFNPHMFGIDGGTEISGAGMSFFVASRFGFNDLSALAIVGAAGDMQDYSHARLVGKNREILDIAKKEEVLEYKNDLRLYGRMSRPILQMLVYSTDPVLPNLTADEKNSLYFLEKLCIPLKTRDGEWRTYSGLEPSEKKALVSALINHCIANNLSRYKMKFLIGEVYELLLEEPGSPLRDAKEFATILNSCGRNNKPDIGIRLCMGERDQAYKEALLMWAKHKTALRTGIEFIQATGIQEKKNYLLIDGKDRISESIIGIIAGMLYSSNNIPHNKPIFALACDGSEKLKISARGNRDLVFKGLDLSAAMKTACEKVDGEGGGHKIAAGAKINAAKKDEFFKVIDEVMKQQMTAQGK